METLKKIVAISILFVVLTLTGEGLGATALPPVKIGVLMPLSGPFAAGGAAAVQSLQLAAETIRQTGGILGRPVTLMITDSQGRADVARTEAVRLVEREGVWALIGGYLSEETVPVQEVAADHGVLHMIPISATMELTSRVAQQYPRFRYSFRVSYNIVQWAELLGDFLIRSGVKRYAFVGTNIRWNREFAETLHTFLTKEGLNRVYEGFYSPQAPQMEPLVLALLERRPEFVVLGDPGRGSVEFVKRAADLGLGASLLSVGGALGDARIARALPVGIRLYFQAAIWRGVTPEATRYFALFQKRYGYLPVGYSDTLPYDALLILAQAANQARSLDRLSIIRTLERGEFKGVAGFYRFDPSHHQAIWGRGGLKGVVIRWFGGVDEVVQK